MPGERPIRTPIQQRLDIFRRGPLTLLVWLGAIGLVATMLMHRRQEFHYFGLAQGRQYSISSVRVGRIESILVNLFDDVEAGDILVKLDDSPIRAKIETVRSTIDKLRAELEAKRIELASSNNRMETDWQADLKNFQAVAEQRHLDVLELKVTIESDRVEEQRLALERERIRQLVERGTLSQSEYDNARLEHERIEKRIEENEILLVNTDEAYRETQVRSDKFFGQKPELLPSESALQPLREAIREQESLIEEFMVESRGNLFRSPVKGRVNRLIAHAGQAIRTGETILTVQETEAREILAFIGEYDATVIQRNDPVEITRMTRPGQVARAMVTRVGSAYELLPERLWRITGQPEYGRPFAISYNPQMHLLPGERMIVRLVGSEHSEMKN